MFKSIMNTVKAAANKTAYGAGYGVGYGSKYVGEKVKVAVARSPLNGIACEASKGYHKGTTDAMYKLCKEIEERIERERSEIYGYDEDDVEEFEDVEEEYIEEDDVQEQPVEEAVGELVQKFVDKVMEKQEEKQEPVVYKDNTIEALIENFYGKGTVKHMTTEDGGLYGVEYSETRVFKKWEISDPWSDGECGCDLRVRYRKNAGTWTISKYEFFCDEDRPNDEWSKWEVYSF